MINHTITTRSPIFPHVFPPNMPGFFCTAAHFFFESGSLAPWEVKHFGSGQFKAIDIAPQLLDNESKRHWMPNQEMQLLAPNY